MAPSKAFISFVLNIDLNFDLSPPPKQVKDKVVASSGLCLNDLEEGHTLGIMVDSDGALHLFSNSRDHGAIARDVLPPLAAGASSGTGAGAGGVCYPILDLYGQCQQVTVVAGNGEAAEAQHEYREKADVDKGKGRNITFAENMLDDHVSLFCISYPVCYSSRQYWFRMELQMQLSDNGRENFAGPP